MSTLGYVSDIHLGAFRQPKRLSSPCFKFLLRAFWARN
jgi:hypothetical protein